MRISARSTFLVVAIVMIAPGAHSQTSTAKPAYPRELPASLVKKARITETMAASVALRTVPGSVIEKMELENEDGKFIYSYDLKTPGKAGIDEIHIDAMTGVVVKRVHETPADEKAEAVRDAKSATKGAKRPPR